MTEDQATEKSLEASFQEAVEWDEQDAVRLAARIYEAWMTKGAPPDADAFGLEANRLASLSFVAAAVFHVKAMEHLKAARRSTPVQPAPVEPSRIVVPTPVVKSQTLGLGTPRARGRARR